VPLVVARVSNLLPADMRVSGAVCVGAFYTGATMQTTSILRALMRKRERLKRGQSTLCGTTSLHRRLSDLREMGVVIVSRRVCGASHNRYFATFVPEHILKSCRPSAKTTSPRSIKTK
jgi:hypothetical protein